MTLTLFDYPASVCAQKVRLVLAEKGVEYERRSVDMNNGEQLSSEYLSINPNGVVPSLCHDGEVFTDASAICEYIEDAFRKGSLAPVEAVNRAHMHSWMRYFEEVTTPAVRWPSWQRFFFPVITGTLGMGPIEWMAQHQPHHRSFYRKLGPNGFSDELIADAHYDLRRTLQHMDKTLATGRPYLLGDQVTLADFIVLPLVVRIEDIGLATLWEDLVPTRAWYDRLQRRPSFDQVFSEPGVRLSKLGTTA
jgi:glutathione S-transferase